MPSDLWEEEEEPITRMEDDESFLFMGALKLGGEDKETKLKFCWGFEELINLVGRIDKFKLLEAIVDIKMNLGFHLSFKYSAAEARGERVSYCTEQRQIKK